MKPALLALVADEGLLARAEAVLTDAEREALAGYTFEKRRRDWLLGRLAAKCVVERVTGVEAARVEIRAEENGHPVAIVDGAAVPGWDVSLSHGHGQAVAAFGPAPVGVDLEKWRAVPEGGWRFFLAPAEREWLAGRPLGEFGEIVAWALKEAAYKAVQGRTQGMQHLTLDEVADGRARIGHPQGPLVARYLAGERFCLAVASPEGGWLDGLAWPAL